MNTEKELTKQLKQAMDDNVKLKQLYRKHLQMIKKLELKNRELQREIKRLEHNERVLTKRMRTE